MMFSSFFNIVNSFKMVNLTFCFGFSIFFRHHEHERPLSARQQQENWTRTKR